MKKIVSIIFLLITIHAFAQKEANVWYFGENAGLDFNSGTPQALNDGQLNTFEGCSSFSDSSGNLLFYSDGTTVWTKDHTIMPGGTGLKGDPSSTQSAMIIPKPGSMTRYYLFTVGSRVNGGDYGFDYYTIDMNTNSGLGSVVAGPVDLSEGRFTEWTEKVAAIKGQECNTYWVLSYVEDEFYAYKVSSSGVAVNPVKSPSQYFANDRRGYLKISPNGKKVAIAHMSDTFIYLYDFNANDGTVSNAKVLSLDVNLPNNPYGLEFSANSEKLYVTASNDFFSNIPTEWNDPNNHLSVLYQFDISSNNIVDINNSRVLIDYQNLYRGGLQLGPDQKIYRALSESYNIGLPSLGVIENPENDGIACNYIHEAISLGGNNSTQGLPPFIASIFSQIEISSEDSNGNINILNDQTINFCAGDNLNITPEPLTGTTITYDWYLNRNTTPFSNANNLLFSNITPAIDGTYKLIVGQTDICGNVSTLEGEFSIKVFDVPTAYQPENIKECDIDNDGFSTFDLQNLKDSEVLNGQNPLNYKVSYFKNQSDADANINEIINPYTNSSAFGLDTIIARIHNIKNPVCFDTRSFTIEVFETPNPPATISSLGKCDNTSIGTDTDGLIIFDLKEKELEILNGQSPTDFTIQYFSDSLLTNEILNSSSFQNTTIIQTIYIKISNNSNSSCFTISNFDIEVYSLPILLHTVVTLEQCDDNLANDGFSFFNLNEANELISANYQHETFEFYAD
ncbi:MAG: hypothetical protein HKP59_00400, partial [Lutibacter sp.]|nr:hypothetical protein [Lutibacter sp.]NNJ56924.1 hypothetical protein [Lutibacter sp.]